MRMNLTSKLMNSSQMNKQGFSLPVQADKLSTGRNPINGSLKNTGLKMHIFEKYSVNGMALKNRLIRSALWMKAAKADGHLTDEIFQTYGDLASGGVGLILTGYIFISHEEQPNPRMAGIYDDSFLEEYTQLTDMVHERGSKIAAQIVFGGSQSHHPEAPNMNILAPSAIKNRVTGLLPKEASRAEIRRIASLFGDAAERAKKAKFDAVQIHAAHGYFLSMFLCPYYNRRNDEYNGSIHDRARIIYEVYAAIRQRVGKDFPVMIKLNFDDFMDDGEGLIFDDAIEVFKHLDQLGIDMFEVSATNESSGKGLMPARPHILKRENESYFLTETAQIAENVNAPVILMGGNRSVERMNEILNSTKIQCFSIARPLLSEPDLITRWERDEHYRPRCISCNKCWETEPNSCIFNRKK
ncbi:2,4-dienoyl-CoA reductase [Desulfobaculum bizertense DSM 18034]|uniref:2,4-dienoyl-CoA reductase n=2 Tax=Desulfobaculum TaxID=1433996 RepID=A0A1T4WWB9_9BACT|nr:2,4-dienoyl-CoA reductase [Desulfobaculum bizertense DSM 18034]